jgi:hypothetical protein
MEIEEAAETDTHENGEEHEVRVISGTSRSPSALGVHR